eukprot:CCRYP_000128-RB/>CCRYP_000128-RB protein AED:0.04 eAED:0.04 QI:195/1/1/1/0/0/4/1311/432
MNFIPSPQREDDQDWHHFQEQPQPYYESLTGLLLQSGSSPTYFDDDESYKYHPAYGMDEDINGAGRESGDGGERHHLVTRRFLKLRKSCCATYDSPLVVILGLCGIFAFGSLLGLLLPSASEERGEDTSSQKFDWDTVSNVLGYSYFLSWTLSFYPQIITNYRNPRGAKEGVSFDFLVWNMIGFACYAAYVTSFLYSGVVRQEYADRFGSTAHPSIVASDGANEMESSIFFIRAGEDDGNVGFVGKLMSRHMRSMPIAAPFTGRMSILCMLFASNHHWIGYDYNETKHIDDFTDDEHDSNSNSNNSTNSNNDKTSNATKIPQNDTKEDPIAVPQVKFNDVAFAWHALILSIITYVQIVRFGKSDDDSSTSSKNNSIIECPVRRETPMSGGWVEREHDIQNFAGLTILNGAPISTGQNAVLDEQHYGTISEQT